MDLLHTVPRDWRERGRGGEDEGRNRPEPHARPGELAGDTNPAQGQFVY